MDSGIECVQEMDNADKQLVKSIKSLLCEIRGPFPESGIENLIHSLLDRPPESINLVSNYIYSFHMAFFS